MASHDVRPSLRVVKGERPATTPESSVAPDDVTLLARLRSHDASVSSQLYRRVRPIVDRTLSRLLGTRDPDYEDVAQLALVELVATIDRYRGECPLDAWLSILTARVAYRHIRRRRLERRIFDATSLEDLASYAPADTSAVVSREAVGRVQKHLEGMDERRAWTFLLHDVYGYDLKEIGQIMGVSLSAAQSRLVRGRRELHERIREDKSLAGFLDGLVVGEASP